MNNTLNKTKINLSTYFILPLLKLNKNSFGNNNFINSFVTQNGEVVVHIKDSSKAGDYYNHSNLIADIEEDDYTMIIYDIPKEWKKDFNTFLDSKYSKMSKEAKKQIIAHAKANELSYKIPTGKKIRETDEGGNVKLVDETASSIEYLGLFSSEFYRKHIEKELDVKLSKDSELLDALNDNDIIEL